MSAPEHTARVLTLALAGALSTAAPLLAEARGVEYCYGVAQAGENKCGHAYGVHACAGQAQVSFDMGDWLLVPAGTCQQMGGSLQPGQGINPRKARPQDATAGSRNR